jgi:branched-subunit amino acid transport protein
VSWTAILVLAAGAYAFKVVGLLFLGPRTRGLPQILRLIALLPPALLAALVAVQTFGGDRALVLDARAAGVAAGAVAVWLRAPFVVVIVVAAAVTAGIRAVAG